MRVMLVWCGLIALGVAACGGDVNRDDYTAANQVVFDGLPTYPGAAITSSFSAPYSVREMGPVSGYTSSVVYGVGSEVMDEDVVAFFEAQLGGEWEHCEYTTQIGSGPDSESVTSVMFIRDDHAMVGIITDGLARQTRSDTFELGVDHDAAKNPCTGDQYK